MTLRPATPGDAQALAALHGASFETAWSAADITNLLDDQGGFGLVVHDETGGACAFVLVRVVLDEAEILTIAVAPARRRQGLARTLVEAAAHLAGAQGAAGLLLEVAVDNPAAIALYHGAEFADVGRRRGYYARKGAAPADALVMRRELNSPRG
ncbi:MAG: GNAT family N-acetyltransferase [Caulobacteraceae bacterium]|nr:GNAT family N-acetyltransferase [Caulobacteraceae bacterium]